MRTFFELVFVRIGSDKRNQNFFQFLKKGAKALVLIYETCIQLCNDLIPIESEFCKFSSCMK